MGKHDIWTCKRRYYGEYVSVEYAENATYNTYQNSGDTMKDHAVLYIMGCVPGGLQTSASANGLSDSLPKAEIDAY